MKTEDLWKLYKFSGNFYGVTLIDKKNKNFAIIRPTIKKFVLLFNQA